LLADKGLSGTPAAWQRLVAGYAGNPLALKIVAQAITDLFGGDLDRFLQEGELMFNGIRPMLRQQVGRLTPLEHLLLTWLAVLREWTKLDTLWEGVSLDTLLEGVETSAEYLTAFCDGGYTTNLPLADVTDGQAWIAYSYDGESLEPEHGGPARLLVPHLYFWKSAKWVRGLRLTATDEPGFWESNGYHNYGDPWKEQRYWGD